MSALQLESVVFWTAVTLYVAAAALAILSLVFERERWQGFVLWAAAVAAGLHGVAIVLRWIEVGHGPYISQYEAMSSNAFAIAVIWILAQQRWRKLRAVAPIVLAAVVIALGAAALAPRSDDLPPFDLLVSEQYNRPDERTINQTAGLIEKTLAEFGIPARVTDFRVGPTVTQFAVEPGYVEKEKNGAEGDLARQKVRVAQISSLARDLALALSAERLRIEAPVPGRPYVGIEVPNPRASIVRLRPILERDRKSVV